MSKKTCPICHTAFSCMAGSDKPCWCSQYPAIMPVDSTHDCLCPSCLVKTIGRRLEDAIGKRSPEDILALARKYQRQEPVEHIDYTVENGRYVFSRWYHLKRGHCCGSGCRHCPYPL